MSWQKSARIGLALTGLAVAGAIVYYSRKAGPPPDPPPPLANLDPRLTSAGAAGVESRSKDGKPYVQIPYATREDYADGRVRFTKAEVIGLGEDKSKMRADVVETVGTATSGEMPSQLKLTGNVMFEEPGGLAIETAAATYDDGAGVVTIPGPVTFRRGRVTGAGVGATYDRRKGIVVIQDQSSAKVAPDAKGAGSAEASSKRMTMERGKHALHLDENARIVSQFQTLTSPKAAMLFTDDETTLKFLELENGARVDPTPGSPANQPAMAADRITMTFQPDGQTLQHATLTGQAALTLRDQTITRSIKASRIDVSTGSDGRTVTGLDAADKVIVELPATASAPARTITSQTLKASGDERKGLTSARFEGNPRFEEASAPAKPGTKSSAGTRTGTSAVIVLTLGGQLEAIEKADFQQNVRFVNDRLTATSDTAIYNEAAGKLELRPALKEPRRRSSVDSREMFVESISIDLELNTENLLAVGDVKTTMNRKQSTGAAATQGGLFTGSEPIFATAAQLRYLKDTGLATYTGAPKSPAVMHQKDKRIQANELVFEENTNKLTGKGEVDSRIPMSVSDDQGKSQLKTQQVKADTMAYDDALRQAVYHGKPVTLTTTDGTTEGLVMTFELAEDGKTLNRLRAQGNVFGSRNDGMQFSGVELEYRVEEDLYILTGRSGSPAVIKQPPADPKAGDGQCDFPEAQRLEFSPRTGSFKSSGSTVGSNKRPCSESLRKPR